MKLNLNQTFKSVYGSEYKMSFPKTMDEKNSNETMENVLLNCLALIPAQGGAPKDIFIPIRLSDLISNSLQKEIEIEEKDVDYLIKAVVHSTNKIVNGKPEGIYHPYLTAQVLKILGVKEEI